MLSQPDITTEHLLIVKAPFQYVADVNELFSTVVGSKMHFDYFIMWSCLKLVAQQ